MNTRILASLAVAGAFLFLPTLRAEPLSESFAEPLGEIPAGWERQDASPKIAANPAPQIASTDRFGALKFERAARSWDNSALFYKNREFSDFTGSVLIHRRGSSPAQALGIALRAQKPRYTFEGYYIAIRYAGRQRGIAICENPVSYNDSGRQLAFAPVPENLASGQDYLLKFSVIGRVIKASLWNADGTAQIGEEAVFEDADRYSAGHIGLRSAFSGGDDQKPVYFRDLTITPVNVAE